MTNFSKLIVFAIVNIIGIQHAVGQEFIRFENRWIQTHQIHNQTGPVTSGVTKPGWYSAQWLTEPVSESGVTYYRLKNRWKGAYLYSKNGNLELGPVEPDWTNAMWVFEKSGTPGYFRVQNLKSKEYLHVQTGSLGFGAIQPNWVSAHWKLLGYSGDGSAPVSEAPATVAQGTATVTTITPAAPAANQTPTVALGDAQIIADDAPPNYISDPVFRNALAAWRKKAAAKDAQLAAELDEFAVKAIERMTELEYWQTESGSFRQISTDETYVWAVNTNDVVFRRPVDGSGGWSEISRKLMHVSATGAGWIWALTDKGAIMRCRKPCASNGAGWKTVRDWPRADDPAVKLIGGPQFAWALTAKGNVLRHPIDGSGTWQASPGQVISTLAAAPNGQLWAAQFNGDPFKCQSPCDGINANWSRVARSPSVSFGVLSIASNATSVVSASLEGRVWHRPLNDEIAWASIPGRLKSVSYAPTGEIWGVGFNGGVYRTSFAKFTEVVNAEKAAAAQEKAAAAQEEIDKNFADAATKNPNAYYHTLSTKSCEWGAPEHSWAYKNRDGYSLISAEGDTFREYFVPPQLGITGRYRYWGPVQQKPSPDADPVTVGFIGEAGYNWVADFDNSGEVQLASARGNEIFVRHDELSPFGVLYEIGGAWGATEYTWAADFTGDGRADIASASGGNVTMRIKTDSQERTNGFRVENWPVAGKWGDAAYTFVGDFNNDGKADIASGYGSTIYMSLSTGTGFTDAAWQAPLAWGSAGYAWVGDFDGDGHKDDIATANGASVSIAYSDGAKFNVRAGSIPNKWGAPQYTWAADFDRDGKTDIASANQCDVAYMRSDGQNFSLQNWALTLPKEVRCSNIFGDVGGVTEYSAGITLDQAVDSARGKYLCR